MKLIEQALAALAFAEKRYHELVDPVATIIENVKALAKATAGHVREMEARLAATEKHLAHVSQVLEEVSGGGWAGLLPAPAAPIAAAELLPPPNLAPAEDPIAAVEEKRAELAAVPVATIPLSPELAAAIEPAPATTEPAPS